MPSRPLKCCVNFLRGAIWKFLCVHHSATLWIFCISWILKMYAFEYHGITIRKMMLKLYFIYLILLDRIWNRMKNYINYQYQMLGIFCIHLIYSCLGCCHIIVRVKRTKIYQLDVWTSQQTFFAICISNSIFEIKFESK